MSTLAYTQPACFEHLPGPHHPESPERLQAVLEALTAPEFADLEWREAPFGTREQVLLVHEASYVHYIRSCLPREGESAVEVDRGDTLVSAGSWDAVMACVGAACSGVDLVMRGEFDNVFCATRPCGHHAEAEKAMGFSIFNQAAIAAFHARDSYDIRVAVVDFDVHHGNGTQASFYTEPNLFYASSHQSPFYPHTGSKSETGLGGNIVNVPLPKGCDSVLFRARISSEMLPALRAWQPDLIIISAGFDAHVQDPLAGLSLEDEDFYWITKQIMQIAEHSACGRVVSILEGGYSLDGLASGASAHVRALMGK